MNKKAEQQILLVRSRTIPTTDRVKICSQFRIHRLFTFCACSSWSWPGVLGCLECIRWGTGWPPDTRRSWSSWRSRSPCTCSSLSVRSEVVHEDAPAAAVHGGCCRGLGSGLKQGVSCQEIAGEWGIPGKRKKRQPKLIYFSALKRHKSFNNSLCYLIVMKYKFLQSYFNSTFTTTLFGKWVNYLIIFTFNLYFLT